MKNALLMLQSFRCGCMHFVENKFKNEEVSLQNVYVLYGIRKFVDVHLKVMQNLIFH